MGTQHLNEINWEATLAWSLRGFVFWKGSNLNLGYERIFFFCPESTHLPCFILCSYAVLCVCKVILIYSCCMSFLLLHCEALLVKKTDDFEKV